LPAMRSLHYVNVFTDRPLAGNALVASGELRI
jgi:hypothetical protein